MQIEIWSDIMCPFCYIGKRKFEAALSQFEGKDDIEIIWKSYQLSPDMVTDSSKNINQYLSEHKGISAGTGRDLDDSQQSIFPQIRPSKRIFYVHTH